MLTKAVSNFCPRLNKPSHNSLRLFKYCQMAKFLHIWSHWFKPTSPKWSKVDGEQSWPKNVLLTGFQPIFRTKLWPITRKSTPTTGPWGRWSLIYPKPYQSKKGGVLPMSCCLCNYIINLNEKPFTYSETTYLNPSDLIISNVGIHIQATINCFIHPQKIPFYPTKNPYVTFLSSSIAHRGHYTSNIIKSGFERTTTYYCTNAMLHTINLRSIRPFHLIHWTKNWAN